jgi:hypothetical protein
MLKIVSVCAALVLAAATFSTSAVARQGGHHFSGGKSFGGGPGKMSYGGPGKMGYGPKYGQWQSGKGGKQYGYWQDGRHRRHYGGYWPWGVGAGLALAATWPYYGGYGYADYGYDDCIQWRPDWGWVNVCESGGYYPY